MASLYPCVKGAAYKIYAPMIASDMTVVTSPTIVEGDIKISKDGGAFANLATTPTPANGLVPIILSTSETDADIFNVRCVDASGDEWIFQEFTVYTTAQTLDTIDGIVDTILDDTNELQGNQSAWATATGFSTHSAADVWAAGTRTLTAGTNLNDISAADVWAAGVRTLTAGTKDSEIDSILADTGELQGDWADGGRLDLILDAAGSAGDPWATELPGAYGAGTAGEIIGGFSSDLTTAIAGLASTSTVTVINTVDGGDAAVYQYATWNATFTLSGSPALEDYENVIFCVKDNPNQADSAALLYVDTATGLKYIGGQVASAAGKGVLTVNSATAFNVYVDVAEVAEKLAGTYSGAATWELKGIETGTTPDEAMPIATGTWRIVKGNIRAIA
jgi:hypothetical protein